MTQFSIPNRPFATELITDLMTPDGIFEATLGQQNINAHIRNDSVTINNVQVYIESVSDPGIVVTPATYNLTSAATGVSHLFSWNADFSEASPGKHLVSFIVDTAAGTQRILKYIFVTKMSFDSATRSYSVTTPQGVMNVAFNEMIGPADPNCCKPKPNLRHGAISHVDGTYVTPNLLSYLNHGSDVSSSPNFTLCAPQLLLGKLKAQVQPTPPYAGQYGDLPFQDPWWKVALCLVAFALLVAAAVAEAVSGGADLTAGLGNTTDDNPSGGNCCGIKAGGGGHSKVAAGLVAAAATVAGIAGASDIRDPFRKGQDHTAPATVGELTIGENLELSLSYPEAVVPGKPFKVTADWKYQRLTNASIYTFSATETNANIHTLSKYVINAPNVVRTYKHEPFIVNAQFYDANNNLFIGNQLFVRCFLIGPSGQWASFVLQDNGIEADSVANDGTYTGSIAFPMEGIGLNGIWKYYVIAQDINHATPDMKPEQAAQIIGGMLLTNQLSISFKGGTCSLVPDGDVNVISL